MRMNVLLLVPFFFSVTVTPGLLIWAWLRWKVQIHPSNLCAHLAFCGLLLATASALLAGSSTMFAQSTGGFAFYDPRLMRIYGAGMLLSIGSLLCGLGGVWKVSPLRWLTPACALGVLVFWFCAATTE